MLRAGIVKMQQSVNLDLLFLLPAVHHKTARLQISASNLRQQRNQSSALTCGQLSLSHVIKKQAVSTRDLQVYLISLTVL